MTIHLPSHIESSIQAAVHSGHFASVNDAMTEAARLLLQKINQNPHTGTPTDHTSTPDPLLGSMKDHADLMDQIVEDAMRHREQQPWRLSPSE
jgi:Arc/MetJ-type ribon-helix-helix transcriptional regulator